MRIVSIKTVKDLTSLGQSSIYDMMKAGTFPRSIKLGVTRVGWILSDVEAWIQARVEESAAADSTGKA